MILFFKSLFDGSPVFIGISKADKVSMADKNSKYTFLLLGEYKKMLLRAADKRLFQKLIDKFKVLKGDVLKTAVLEEMGLAASFKKKISVEEYLDFYKTINKV